MTNEKIAFLRKDIDEKQRGIAENRSEVSRLLGVIRKMDDAADAVMAALQQEQDEHDARSAAQRGTSASRSSHPQLQPSTQGSLSQARPSKAARLE